jgi:hypothetical protein
MAAALIVGGTSLRTIAGVRFRRNDMGDLNFVFSGVIGVNTDAACFPMASLAPKCAEFTPDR